MSLSRCQAACARKSCHLLAPEELMPRTCTCWLEQLSELRLHDNKIGDAGAAALASSLQTNARISVLVLGHNEIKELGGASLGTYGGREREKRKREG